MTLATIEQSGEVTGQADVLIDNAPVVLGYFSRGELAPIVAEEGFAPVWDGYYTLYVNGIYAYVPAGLIQVKGAENYTQWDGFSGYSAKVYDNYLLQGEGTPLGTNTVVTVLWDGTDYYVVSINGEIGYIPADQVGVTRYATGGGGSSSSGNSSSGGGSEWSPPVL